jgi:catechol-2,3-dioxygenase
MPEFPALGHVALTVTDRSVSAPWYTSLFGADPALDEDTGEFHHVVWVLGNTLFGIHTFPEPPAAGDKFDEHRIGLDHVSFGVADREQLKEWQGHLEGLGIEHGGIKDAPYGSGISFRDPDNNALEFFCPPAG